MEEYESRLQEAVAMPFRGWAYDAESTQEYVNDKGCDKLFGGTRDPRVKPAVFVKIVKEAQCIFHDVSKLPGKGMIKG
jgi:hypothetical protein